VNRDLLISMDSLFAAEPVWLYLSDPARSTNYNLDTTTLSKLSIPTYSIVNESIEWDLLEELFILCEATTLFLIPKWYKAITSSTDLHSKVYKFSTENTSFLFHFSLRPGPFVVAPFTCDLFNKSYILSL
jgi:hypothetical protein